jgi:hypothetical protein
MLTYAAGAGGVTLAAAIIHVLQTEDGKHFYTHTLVAQGPYTRPYTSSLRPQTIVG